MSEELKRARLAVEAAWSATERGRRALAEVVRQMESLDAEQRQASAAAHERLLAAIKGDRELIFFDGRPFAARRAELAARRAAVERVVADLHRAEQDAEAVLADLQAAASGAEPQDAETAFAERWGGAGRIVALARGRLLEAMQ